MKQWQIFLMAGLFLAVCNNLGEAEAASPVSIVADRTNFDIMEDGTVTATLTLANADTTYRTMDVYLEVNWPSGVDWTSRFTDTNYDEFANNEVNLTKGGNATVLFTVFCNTYCEGGDTNVVLIIAHTDPRWYPNGNNASDENNTCGSDDCETDTTPASGSSNTTNPISMTFTARMAYDSVVNCDAESSEGGNVVTPGNTTLWGYTLTNTGWNADTYQYTIIVTSADGHDVWYWVVGSGIADGRELTGQSDTSLAAVHTIATSISIIPATNATPGVYNIDFTVTSTNGAPTDGCNFDVIVPGSETEEETTGDPANETVEEETAEKETEEEIEEEVPSISLITALISIGIIALRRRY